MSVTANEEIEQRTKWDYPENSSGWSGESVNVHVLQRFETCRWISAQTDFKNIENPANSIWNLKRSLKFEVWSLKSLNLLYIFISNETAFKLERNISYRVSRESSRIDGTVWRFDSPLDHLRFWTDASNRLTISNCSHRSNTLIVSTRFCETIQKRIPSHRSRVNHLATMMLLLKVYFCIVLLGHRVCAAANYTSKIELN